MPKSKNKCAPSCDWEAPQKPAEQQLVSTESCKLADTDKIRTAGDKILRHKGGFRWSGVRTEKYKQQDGSWSAIVRNVLIGNRGETAKFHLRYFEIDSGGFSSLERHRHEHAVICVRGKGRVIIGEKSYLLHYLDTVYIAPNTIHQFVNPYNEPFGFFCIVNAKRDKPKPLESRRCVKPAAKQH